MLVFFCIIIMRIPKIMLKNKCNNFVSSTGFVFVFEFLFGFKNQYASTTLHLDSHADDTL